MPNHQFQEIKALHQPNHSFFSYIQFIVFAMMQEVWTDHGIYVLNRVFIRGIPNTVIYPTNAC